MNRHLRTIYTITEPNIGELSHHFEIKGYDELGKKILDLKLGNNKNEAELLRSALDIVQPEVIKVINTSPEEIPFTANKKATYRIIYFTKPNKYIGMAWNYNEAIMISTDACATYTEAKAALEKECNKRQIELRWFDGEYVCKDGETLESIE